jgi:hypothetical protein
MMLKNLTAVGLGGATYAEYEKGCRTGSVTKGDCVANVLMDASVEWISLDWIEATTAFFLFWHC